jgi:hypothetical protein
MGGSSGGQQQQQTAQDQTLNPNSAAVPGYGYLAGSMQNQMDAPVGYFPGAGYVGPSNLTQQAVGMNADAGQQYGQAGNMVQNAAMAGYGAVPGMFNVANQAGQNYGFLSRAADVANNPYVQNQLRANSQAAMGTLGQMMPTVNSGAASVNAMGSGRHGLMQGSAISGTLNNLMQQNTGLMTSAYGQGLGAQQYALGQTGQMQNNLSMPYNYMGQLGQMYGQGAGLRAQGGQIMGQAGTNVEQYQQQALQDAMNRYAYQYQEPYQRNQNTMEYLNAMAPTGVQRGMSTQQAQGGGGGRNVGQMIGGAAMMVGGAYTGNPALVAGGASMAGQGYASSDRRLKRNIKQIGKTAGGINIYSFDYVWGQPAVGVMSDEVDPSWVKQDEFGFDMVDYSKVR